MADPILTAEIYGRKQVRLSWTFGSNANFQIFWKSNVPSGQEYQLLATTNAFTYVTPELEPTMIYDFYIRAFVGMEYFYSNVVELFVSCGKGVALIADPPPSPDPQPTGPGGCYAELDVFHDNFSNGIGVSLRYDPSSRKGYVCYTTSSDTWDVWKYNFPSRLSLFGGAFPGSHSIHRLRLEIEGNPPELRFYVNNILLGSGPDSSGNSIYETGFAAAYASGGSGGAVSGGNNFVCGNITRWGTKIPILSDPLDQADHTLNVSPWLDLIGGDNPCRVYNGRLAALVAGTDCFSSYDNSLGVITP